MCVAEIAADAIASPCSYTRYRIASQEKILSPKPVRYMCRIDANLFLSKAEGAKFEEGREVGPI